MRLSLAIENGCLDDAADFNWIHQNNGTFASTLRDLVTAKYTFVILRCPYTRLASAFLDKMVRREADYWNLLRQKNSCIDVYPLTFRKFAEAVCTESLKRSNIHWRPQIDFLVYKEYDRCFQFEKLAEAFQTLRNDIGISIRDARPFTRHGQNGFDSVEDGRFSDMAADEILQMNREGKSPGRLALFDEEIRGMVEEAYSADLELYTVLFGTQELLFPTKRLI